ncbi:shikimate dehydrogenase [Trueperella abortisuis]|uniref:shikimate dehydrogenase n=1 Tax=Trueperella abortisuis TaxID=445930 RepID=UPI002893801B|nr:shikimate dehydrogenase [Trueperella abortisuis]
MDARTQVFAIIGNPARHSKSPELHNAVFSHLGINAVYVAHEVDDAGAAVAAMRVLGYAGANVTMPFKSAVIEHLDSISDVAREMNAVNTITFRDGHARGDNTDGAGLLSEIEAEGTSVAGSHIVLLGTGGAASSIWTQAALDGAARVSVFNRVKPELASIRDTLDRLSTRSGCALSLHTLEAGGLEEACADADIIINATSVGMGHLAGQTLVDARWITSGHTVADVVYHPRITRLIAEARAAGAKTVPGLRMLLGQAAIAERIWLGIDMPMEVARQAVTS